MTITVTMRGAGDGPWMTIRADSVDEMVAMINRPPGRLLDTLKGMTKDNLCVCGENHCGCGDDECFFCEHDGDDVFEHDSVQLACDLGKPPDLSDKDRK